MRRHASAATRKAPKLEFWLSCIHSFASQQPFQQGSVYEQLPSTPFREQCTKSVSGRFCQVVGSLPSLGLA